MVRNGQQPKRSVSDHRRSGRCRRRARLQPLSSTEAARRSADQRRAQRPEDREQVMRGPLMRNPYELSVSTALLGAALLIGAAAPAQAQTYGRAQDITDLRLGQRVLVDDGTCPAGQVKEVSGVLLFLVGVARAFFCVP